MNATARREIIAAKIKMSIKTILRIGQIALCVAGEFERAIRTGNTISIAEQEVDLTGSVLNAYRFSG